MLCYYTPFLLLRLFCCDVLLIIPGAVCFLDRRQPLYQARPALLVTAAAAAVWLSLVLRPNDGAQRVDNQALLVVMMVVVERG